MFTACHLHVCLYSVTLFVNVILTCLLFHFHHSGVQLQGSQLRVSMKCILKQLHVCSTG